MKRTYCAIYTRKSSDEGLEQEFNSLDAQREACEAFIKSQKHEGWVCLPVARNQQHPTPRGLKALETARWAHTKTALRQGRRATALKRATEAAAVLTTPARQRSPREAREPATEEPEVPLEV